VVGPHKVSVNWSGGQDAKTEDRDAGGPRGPRERLPEVYNYKTTLTFDVPAGGTEAADFPLKARP
jgi:hypothetical protein